jgi:hypothetical protein
LGKFEKKCDEGFLLGYSTTSKAYRVWNLTSGTLEEIHDVEFDKTQGSQDENENLEEVGGIQLSNAMKNMDVGKLRPRQVDNDEDHQVQVISNVQDDTNQTSTSSSHDNVEDQQVASTSSQPNDQASASNQVSIL